MYMKKAIKIYWVHIKEDENKEKNMKEIEDISERFSEHDIDIDLFHDFLLKRLEETSFSSWKNIYFNRWEYFFWRKKITKKYITKYINEFMWEPTCSIHRWVYHWEWIRWLLVVKSVWYYFNWREVMIYFSWNVIRSSDSLCDKERIEDTLLIHLASNSQNWIYTLVNRRGECVFASIFHKLDWEVFRNVWWNKFIKLFEISDDIIEMIIKEFSSVSINVNKFIEMKKLQDENEKDLLLKLRKIKKAKRFWSLSYLEYCEETLHKVSMKDISSIYEYPQVNWFEYDSQMLKLDLDLENDFMVTDSKWRALVRYKKWYWYNSVSITYDFTTNVLSRGSKSLFHFPIRQIACLWWFAPDIYEAATDRDIYRLTWLIIEFLSFRNSGDVWWFLPNEKEIPLKEDGQYTREDYMNCIPRCSYSLEFFIDNGWYSAEDFPRMQEINIFMYEAEENYIWIYMGIRKKWPANAYESLNYSVFEKFDKDEFMIWTRHYSCWIATIDDFADALSEFIERKTSIFLNKKIKKWHEKDGRKKDDPFEWNIINVLPWSNMDNVVESIKSFYIDQNKNEESQDQEE